MQPSLTQRQIFLLAGVLAAVVGNLYYAQPLTAPMAQSLGLDPAIAGLVVTLTQGGYGLGVLLLVPLGDLMENRKIILSMFVVAMFALLGIGLSQTPLPYFIAAVILGVGTSAIQVIVPYATHLSPANVRGRVVGTLMSGVMLGIMFSRPLASFLTDLFSWHAVYYLSAGMMLAVLPLLYVSLPRRQPESRGLSYSLLLFSMSKLVFQYSVLRRRAFYQACMFSAFCLFWTATPLLLNGPRFHISQTGIAFFALVGVAGAVFAPFAGRMADKGLTQRASWLAFCAGSFAFLLTRVVPVGSGLSLGLLTAAAILLDAGVSCNLVLGQRAIFSLEPELRSRLNSVYIAIIFIGGSIGSFLGAWAYVRGGWELTAWIGFALPTLGLLVFLTEFLKVKKSPLPRPEITPELRARAPESN